MNVKQAHEALQKLIDAGHGDRPLIVCDTRSGDTNEASIYHRVEALTQHDAGWACDAPTGTLYVPIFIG